MSILFNLRVSVLFPQTLKTTMIRHDFKDLAKIDVLVLHTGGLHYSTIGKGRHHSIKGHICSNRVGEGVYGSCTKVTLC